MEKKTISAELITRFKEHLILEERSWATVEKYIRDVRVFSDFVGDYEISKETVIEYKRQLQEKYKIRSVNSVLASLNSFFGFVGWWELKVKSIKLQKQIYCSEEKELTRKEYERLCKAAKSNKNERLNMILQTICGTGIRVSELQFIIVKTVQNGEAIVSLKNKTRTVFIVRKLRQKSLNRNLLLQFACLILIISAQKLCKSDMLVRNNLSLDCIIYYYLYFYF